MIDTVATLRARLEAAASRTAEILAVLTAEDLDCPAGGEWTVRDTLVHVATSERGVQAVLDGLSRGESVVPVDFDLDRWNAAQVARQRNADLRALRELIAATRQATYALVARLTDADLSHRGRHALGREVTLGEALAIMAAHERAHMEEAAYAVLRVGRP